MESPNWAISCISYGQYDRHFVHIVISCNTTLNKVCRIQRTFQLSLPLTHCCLSASVSLCQRRWCVRVSCWPGARSRRRATEEWRSQTWAPPGGTAWPSVHLYTTRDLTSCKSTHTRARTHTQACTHAHTRISFCLKRCLEPEIHYSGNGEWN